MADKGQKKAAAKKQQRPRMISKPVGGEKNGGNRTVRASRLVRNLLDRLQACISVSLFWHLYWCIYYRPTLYAKSLCIHHQIQLAVGDMTVWQNKWRFILQATL